MPLRDDYAGPFDPDFSLASLSRPALARLGRETMLLAHIHDRALMPLVASQFGAPAMTEVAIDEWMGASPVYNARNRALLGVRGDGVSSILKSLQLDVGAPHQYMDFRFELVDETRGFFWLDYCGALVDVSRAAGGDPGPIIQMCHHMEDPTFDATAMAVNPRARCRPVHRPPLAIGHSGPVCRWEVRISSEAGVLEEREITRTVRRTRAARFAFEPELEPEGEAGGGGLDDYAGSFLPDFALEDLSQRALVTQCKEFALDVNLLVRAAYLSIAGRFGPAALAGVAREHWAAAAPIYVGRLRRALGILGDDAASLLKTLQLDPALPPDYVDKGCALLDERHGLFWVNDCEALADDEPRGWPGELGAPESPGLDAVAAAVNPRARCRPVDPAAAARGGAKPALAYEIEIDPAAEPREESRWARAARFSSASSFVFRSGPR